MNDREAGCEAIVARWRCLCAELDAHGVRLIAVSKYAPDAAVTCLAAAGQVDFGESRPQQLRERAERFPGVRWHMIGPVQRNKAKYVGRHAAMWHSLEDIDTAREVARHVEGRRLPVLIQVNVSDEPQKHGVSPDAVPALLDQVRQLPELEVIGLMGMAARHGDARAAFARLRDLRDGLADASLRQLCMGMSGDYRIAVEEGATMVRLGSVLFGAEG
jgi:pyridoxal phosphate enzyme (YggS family)